MAVVTTTAHTCPCVLWSTYTQPLFYTGKLCKQRSCKSNFTSGQSRRDARGATSKPGHFPKKSLHPANLSQIKIQIVKRREIYCSWSGKRNGRGEHTEGGMWVLTKLSGTLVWVCVCLYLDNLLCVDWYPVRVLWKLIWHATGLEKYSLNKTPYTLNTGLSCVKLGLTSLKKQCSISTQLLSLFSLLDEWMFFLITKKLEQQRIVPMSLNTFSLSLDSVLHLQQNMLQVNLPAVKHEDQHLMTKTFRLNKSTQETAIISMTGHCGREAANMFKYRASLPLGQEPQSTRLTQVFREISG